MVGRCLELLKLSTVTYVRGLLQEALERLDELDLPAEYKNTDSMEPALLPAFPSLRRRQREPRIECLFEN